MILHFSAYEVLGVPLKRRSYDSVDDTFNESIPSVNTESKEKFYSTFAPVMESNARFVQVYVWNKV